MLAAHRREHGHLAEAPHRLAAVESSVRLGAVLDKGQTPLPGQLGDRLDIRRLAGDVGDDNGAGVGCQNRLDLRRTGVEGTRRRVSDYRHLVQQGNRHDPSRVGDRRHHYFARRLELESTHRRVQSCRTGVDQVGEAAAEEVGEFALVRRFLRTAVADGVPTFSRALKELDDDAPLLVAKQVSLGKGPSPYGFPSIYRQHLHPLSLPLGYDIFTTIKFTAIRRLGDRDVAASLRRLLAPLAPLDEQRGEPRCNRVPTSIGFPLLRKITTP